MRHVTCGQDKCGWGIDYPLLPHGETLSQINGLGLRETAPRKLLSDNAARIFRLSLVQRRSSGNRRYGRESAVRPAA